MEEKTVHFQKILIVDDERFIIKILQESLKGLSDTILTASNGQEAMQVAERERPEMIISDIMMPEMNGMELLQAIRENPTTCLIPFILLTVKDTTQDFLDGYDSGADYYLTKPFEYPQLIRSLETALRVRERENKK